MTADYTSFFALQVENKAIYVKFFVSFGFYFSSSFSFSPAVPYLPLTHVSDEEDCESLSSVSVWSPGWCCGPNSLCSSWCVSSGLGLGARQRSSIAAVQVLLRLILKIVLFLLLLVFLLLNSSMFYDAFMYIYIVRWVACSLLLLRSGGLSERCSNCFWWNW